ncbi:MAG: adenylate kinase family protein, partial [Phycisphaerales bacterium JB041]
RSDAWPAVRGKPSSSQPADASGLQGLVPDEGGITAAIDLEVPEDVVVERISSRRVCTQCGTIYTASDESGRTGVCERCGGEVVQRDDDTEDAVRARLSTYNEQTAPLLGHFEAQGLLRVVDGVGDPDEVHTRVLAEVEAALAAG